jgi:phosphopentomutase
VIGVGKIGDIFAGQGITDSFSTESNAEGMKCIASAWETLEAGLLFANLVDFDMLYGHRRDVSGYARMLEQFDQWLGEFLPTIRASDLVIITADHGNDPTYRGTDHTREQVPLFVLYNDQAADLGTRPTFADVAATLSAFFRLPNAWLSGNSFLPKNEAIALPDPLHETPEIRASN